METSEKIIELTFDRKHFEEIYLGSGKGSFFFSPAIRSSFIAFVSVLFAFITSIVYSLITDRHAWVIAILFVVLMITFINYYSALRVIIKWRKSVFNFLKENDTYKVQKLIVTANSVTLVQDKKETIARWSSFTHLVIEERYLLLNGIENFLFPKDSMNIDDYLYLTKIARTKIRNGL